METYDYSGENKNPHDKRAKKNEGRRKKSQLERQADIRCEQKVMRIRARPTVKITGGKASHFHLLPYRQEIKRMLV